MSCRKWPAKRRRPGIPQSPDGRHEARRTKVLAAVQPAGASFRSSRRLPGHRASTRVRFRVNPSASLEPETRNVPFAPASFASRRRLKVRTRSHRLTLGASVALMVSIAACAVHKPAPKDPVVPTAAHGWLHLNPEARLRSASFVSDQRELLEIEPGSELRQTGSETDELGMTHDRYQQYYRGIRVEGAELLVHSRNGITESVNGVVARHLASVPTAPRIAADEARDTAIRTMRAAVAEESTGDGTNPLIAWDGRPAATELVITQRDGHETFGPDDLVLAWRIDMVGTDPLYSRSVYVDATDGAVAKILPLFGECESGRGNTTWRGNQQFNTRRNGDVFVLEDDCRTARLHVVNALPLPALQEFVDADNNWIAGADQSPVTSFWALGIAYDYFELVHNRHGYDGKNGSIELKHGQSGARASGGNGRIRIGVDGVGPNDDYNTTDIIGHEYTHNVIETSAKLVYGTTEPSALNESFSDIFGNLIEAWDEQNQTPSDWRVGEDKGCTVGTCRNMADPGSLSGPDTYKGTNWDSGGEPHNNGEVQNFWFYLLAAGGSGSNDMGDDYSVTGIGLSKAGKIAYRTLTKYLTSSARYVDARDASIQATADLYGSAEVAQVKNAWCAVGLCPEGTPDSRDRFDITGGNPNPASPNNNNSLGGATPIGQSVAASWTADGPSAATLSVAGLSVYPSDDVDYFELNPIPDGMLQPTSIPPECVARRYVVRLSAPATIRVHRNGQVVSTKVDSDVVSIDVGQILQGGTTAVSIQRAFPGQVIAYDMSLRYSVSFDPSCIPEVPPLVVLEYAEECPACGEFLLADREQRILDPLVVDSLPSREITYYVYAPGGRDMGLVIDLLRGESLRAALRDMSGRLLSVADTHSGFLRGGLRALSVGGPGFSGNGARRDTEQLLLSPGPLPEGIYALTLSHFGYGSEVVISQRRAAR